MRRLLVIAFAFIVFKQEIYAQARDTSFNPSLRLMSSLYQRISRDYVERIDYEKMGRKAIDAMMSQLDPWSFYLNKKEADLWRSDLNTKYGGIGISMKKIDDDIVVVDVKKGHAAERAGIKTLDIIVSVDGKPMKGKTTDDVIDVLRGDPGTKVTVDF